MTRAFTVLSPDDAGPAAIVHASAFDVPWPPSELRRLLAAPISLAIGAEMDGELIGFILAQIVADEADILTVAVDTKARRKGHAAALLKALHNRLGERGVSRATLDVAADNIGAIALYETAGYARDGTRPKYYKRAGKPPVDAILMSRDFTL